MKMGTSFLLYRSHQLSWVRSQVLGNVSNLNLNLSRLLPDLILTRASAGCKNPGMASI
jgi:hypothetical protein